MLLVGYFSRAFPLIRNRTGANVADFYLTDGCGASIPAGKSCTAMVSFDPRLTGIGD
jgi:hypothetical protein